MQQRAQALILSKSCICVKVGFVVVVVIYC